ncbi:hypothetical protein [Enterovibrio coralii]|uniref:Uncharacterized protein n=1 Tax=Enterovibrio coralii TaxID=294935 RepID=A0A135ICB0_9GAMM|nr:hypothetical protein [Enterovibrio coralii]KXF83106.1 hypothetical protein ATN88_05165 [Enterovibrio coralii]
MKTTSLVALFIPFVVNATDHHEVNLFDERIVVEVKTDTSHAFDETPIWQTLEAKGWEDAKQAAQGNQVSEKLAEELAFRESLEKLKNAMKRRRYNEADTFLAGNESWVTCERIQWLWLDLQREVVTGYGDNAKRKFQYALDNCQGHEKSTTAKVFGWAGSGAGKDIISRYRQSAGFDETVAKGMEHDLMLSTLSKNTVTSSELQGMEPSVKARKDGNAAEVIGWKYIEGDDAPSALDWFDRAIRWSGPTQKRVEGKLLSLQKMGEIVRLKEEHQTWVKKYPNLSDLEFVAEPESALNCEGTARDCLVSLLEKKEMTGSDYALQGWKLYEIERPMSASIAFERALAKMDASDPDRDLTQYGYVMSLQQLGFEDKATALAMEIDDDETRIELDRQLAMKRVYTAFNAKHYETTLSHIQAYEMAYGKDVKLIEVKAWSLYNSQKKIEAMKEYAKLTAAFPHNEEYQESYMIIKCGVTTKDPKCKKYNS